MTTVAKVKAAWDENNARLQVFNPNMTVTNLGCGYIFIDTEHKMACISNQKKLQPHSIVFTFSELEEYRIEKVVKKRSPKPKVESQELLSAVPLSDLPGPLWALPPQNKKRWRRAGFQSCILIWTWTGWKPPFLSAIRHSKQLNSWTTSLMKSKILQHPRSKPYCWYFLLSIYFFSYIWFEYLSHLECWRFFPKVQ